MKILVIQLARLGDIYMSWPALRALRRTHPEAQIHLLTRPRFEGAVEGLTAIDKHISLPVRDILEPLIQAEADVDASLQRLNAILDSLQAENYDKIINLTFSPASSYLTHAVTGLCSEVMGYTRYNDGTLCLADEVSAYFYAQVGIGKSNRVHISDVFASMLNIEYTQEDWAAPAVEAPPVDLPDCYLVLHVGASEKQKSLQPASWARVLNYFNRRYAGMPIVLIGAPNERVLADEIKAAVTEASIIDLVGQTKISDLFGIIQEAELLIGCDSAPIHIASLTDTPTLNISVGDVNYWETGPKATLGFIYRLEKETDLVPERLGEVVALLLEGQMSPELISRTGGIVSYEGRDTVRERFQWDLVQALYLGAPYPVAEKIEIIQGALQLQDINNFAREQISLIPEKGLQNIGPLLDRAEEVIQNISRIIPELGPLVSWYQAEKVRIGPGSLEEICTAALNVHERWARHLEAYIPSEAVLTDEEEVHDGTL